MKIWKSGLLAVALLFAAPAWADDLSNGSWSTTDNSNNATPPNGWPAGMAPNQVEPTARSNMGGTKRWWERANPNLSTTGSAGAYILTPSNTSYPTAYTQGEVICAKANFTAAGSDTLNVNGLGAKPLYIPSAAGFIADPANTLITGQQFCASYDGALNSGGGGFQILTLPAPYLAAGSWTPTLVGSSGGSAILSVAVGSYVNIGTWWQANAVITVSSVGSIAGNLQIGNFPWMQANISSDPGECSVTQFGNISLPASTEFLAGAEIAPNTKLAILLASYIGSSQPIGSSAIPASALNSGSSLTFTCSGHT